MKLAIFFTGAAFQPRLKMDKTPLDAIFQPQLKTIKIHAGSALQPRFKGGLNSRLSGFPAVIEMDQNPYDGSRRPVNRRVLKLRLLNARVIEDFSTLSLTRPFRRIPAVSTNR